MTPPSNNNAPFFIVGCGRSGTTLVRSLLSSHPRLIVTPETHLLHRARNEGVLDGEFQDFDSFWDGLTKWVRFQDLGLDAGEVRARFDRQQARDFPTLFSTILQLYGEQHDTPRVGEKTPGHVQYLDKLFEWFPEAKVIATIRDPRAVVASQLKTPWAQRHIAPRSLQNGVFVNKRRNQVMHYAKDWNDVTLKMIAPWIMDQRVLPVRYDDLVNDPEGEMLAVCTFLGEEFDPQMLEERRKKTPDAKGSIGAEDWQDWRRDHERKSQGQIATTSLDKWRQQLSTDEIALIEGYCGRGMEAAGYEQVMSRSAQRRAMRRAFAHRAAELLEWKLRDVAEHVSGYS